MVQQHMFFRTEYEYAKWVANGHRWLLYCWIALVLSVRVCAFYLHCSKKKSASLHDIRSHALFNRFVRTWTGCIDWRTHTVIAPSTPLLSLNYHRCCCHVASSVVAVRRRERVTLVIWRVKTSSQGSSLVSESTTYYCYMCIIIYTCTTIFIHVLYQHGVHRAWTSSGVAVVIWVCICV